MIGSTIVSSDYRLTLEKKNTSFSLKEESAGLSSM